MEKMTKPYIYKTLLLIISFLSVFGCTNQNKKYIQPKVFPYYKTDLEEMSLKGKVKSLQEHSYKSIDSFGVVLKGEKQFKNGFESYPFGGYFKFNIEGSFDEVIEYNDVNLIKEKKMFVYNNSNKVKKEENIYGSNKELIYKTTYKYNNKNYLINKSEYRGNGTLSGVYVYNNDSTTNQIDIESYFSKGELYSLIKKSYDKKGNLISSDKRYFNSPLISMNSYFTYDEKMNLILEKNESTIKEGTVETEYNYTYNEKGDKTEFWIDSPSNKTIYEYKYDSYNNWVKRIEFSKGLPKFILEREIQYY